MLQFISQRLKAYNMYGDFYKKFINPTGPHLKSVKDFGDNIKLKLKRDLFIQIHENGWVYLVDSVVSPKDVTIETKAKVMKGLPLIRWDKKDMPTFLDKLDKWIKKPEIVLSLAASRIDPIIIAREAGKKGAYFGLRESDLAEVREYTDIDMSASINIDDQPLINAKRKG